MPAFFRAHGNNGNNGNNGNYKENNAAGSGGKNSRNQYIRTHYMQTTGASPRTDDEVRELLRLLPRYRVMLHNDAFHSMDEVILALVRTVPSLSIKDATAIMFEAHTTGCAQVIICPREPAEYYRERLERLTLTSTIEPV